MEAMTVSIAKTGPCCWEDVASQVIFQDGTCTSASRQGKTWYVELSNIGGW